ncbi:MAG: ABC transporter permease [Cyclobacteriaceae bacterium]|nr:ABC transporter permease [Cyclobacteriaceae bacterium]
MKETSTPPKPALRFFRWYCHPRLRDYIEGDLMEVYERRLNKSGKRKADLFFIIDVLLLCRPGIIKPTEGYKNLNTYGMYKSYLKTAWRNIIAKKTHAAINVSGLALGISCALLIFSLISYHLDIDNFHNNSDRIYRFVTEAHRDQVSFSGSVPPSFGKAFRDDYTFGEKTARLCTLTDQLIAVEEDADIRKFKEEVAFAEPEFFDIFNFPLVSGKRDNMLTEPNTALVSERIAKKYFDDESPLGKTFRFDNRIDFTITGVLKDIPDNTDLRSEIYFSYSTIKQYNHWYAGDDDWGWGGITTDIQTFARLQPGVTPAEVELVLPAYVKKYRAESKNVHHYKLQPLDDVHFNAKYGGRMDKTILWVLAMVGFLLVFTACLNFINLATAQAVTRAKEVGIRKVLGSVRTQLFWQFTTETGVIVLLATLLAFFVSYAVLPYVNEFFNIRITLNLFSDISALWFLLALMFTVTFLSGAYPGIVLSGFRPVQALKGKFQGQQGGSFNIRRGLIITQFTISQVLLIGLIVVFYQMKYFRNTDMGFNHEAVVMIPTGSNDTKANTLKEQFLAIPQVENVSLCFAAPASNEHWSTSFRYDNRSETETFSVNVRNADENYLSTFGIGLVAGRNLTPSDTAREFLVNEKMAAKLGLSSPEDMLGRPVAVNGDSWIGPVVGVVKDFHDQSLRSDIEPIAITTAKETYNAFAIKINMKDAANTLAALEKAWSSMYPELMYQYDFLDDQIAAFYRIEQAMMTLTQVFSCIALVIGCMGLYGLVSFMAIQKTKEIGIRKVLGGDVSQILWIFGKEFSRLVIIAFLIAAPVGWMLMSRWLSLYAYKVDMGIWIFMLELAIILGVVLLTVGYRSVRAALANPVESLRTE